MTALRQAEAVLETALKTPVFSAVTAEIGSRSGPRWAYAAGNLAFGAAAPVTRDTVFDLASLTKVIATTALAMLLVRERRLQLDARVADLIGEWTPPDRQAVTIADLLEHSSGLPAYREYYRHLRGLDAYVAAIAHEPLEAAPRARSIYSDLGFIVLGKIIERIGERRLDEQFNAWKAQAGIADPLTYRPPVEWALRTAATEYDAWRRRTLQGEVHDQNAAALGGVAAHAGLFGTAAAVGAAARWWMSELGTPEGRRFALRSSVPGSSRALGWDTMLPTSSCGSLMSPMAIGHTGFTGTTLWIDPDRDVYFVLLTNRVLVPDSADLIRQVRRDFHEAAIRDLS